MQVMQQLGHLTWGKLKQLQKEFSLLSNIPQKLMLLLKIQTQTKLDLIKTKSKEKLNLKTFGLDTLLELKTLF